MRTTLVIMAAGLGSRFGGGIKQLAPVGLNGEIIMDYSIHDAIEAGFNKIVFIIRKDIKDAFKEAIGDRIEKICNNLDVEIAYAYQELSELPEGVELPTGRTKPWGTGHKELSDYDKRNEFDVEAYMRHRMEVKLTRSEEFDLYVFSGDSLMEQENNENKEAEHVENPTT